MPMPYRYSKPEGCEWSELVVGPGFLSFTPCPTCHVIHLGHPHRIRLVKPEPTKEDP